MIGTSRSARGCVCRPPAAPQGLFSGRLLAACILSTPFEARATSNWRRLPGFRLRTLPRRVVAKTPSLHPGEHEVLGLLCSGGSQSAEIALRLVISPSTAKSHVRNILVKLGVHSRPPSSVFMRCQVEAQSARSYAARPPVPGVPASRWRNPPSRPANSCQEHRREFGQKPLTTFASNCDPAPSSRRCRATSLDIAFR